MTYCNNPLCKINKKCLRYFPCDGSIDLYYSLKITKPFCVNFVRDKKIILKCVGKNN